MLSRNVEMEVNHNKTDQKINHKKPARHMLAKQETNYSTDKFLRTREEVGKGLNKVLTLSVA